MEVEFVIFDGLFFCKEDFVGRYIIICGVVLLQLIEALNFLDKLLVMVSLIVNNFYLFVLSVVLGCGVFFEGFIGCGKIIFVEYVVKVVGRFVLFEFMKIQLGD